MEFQQVDFVDGNPSGITVSLTADEGKFLAQLLGKQSDHLLREAGLKPNQVFLGLYMKFEQLFNKGLLDMMEQHG